jgi:dephospho-CoA kinase
METLIVLFSEIIIFSMIVILICILLLPMAVTGSTGSGKSFAVSYISRKFKNVKILDSDVIAKSLLQPGTRVYEKAMNFFGPEILTDGTLDRKKLAEIIFKDEKKRKFLNSLMHIQVFKQILLKSILYEILGYKVICDIPLLIEIAHKNSFILVLFRPVILITASEETRFQRLLKRDSHLPENIIRGRINAQLSESEKLRFADVVITNDDENSELFEESINKTFKKLGFSYA